MPLLPLLLLMLLLLLLLMLLLLFVLSLLLWLLLVALDVVVATDDVVVALVVVVQHVIVDVVVDAWCQMFAAMNDYVCLYLCFLNILVGDITFVDLPIFIQRGITHRLGIRSIFWRSAMVLEWCPILSAFM